MTYITEFGIALVIWYFACLLDQGIKGRARILELLGSLMHGLAILVFGVCVFGLVTLTMSHASPLGWVLVTMIGCTVYLANILKSGRG